MKYRGKVQRASLKEVSMIDVPFWLMDPKGMAVDTGYRGTTEALHNQAVKTGAAFMSGSELGRMKKRRRIVPLLQSSIVKRAKIREAAIDPETGEMRQDLYSNETITGGRGVKKKRGATIAAEEGGTASALGATGKAKPKPKPEGIDLSKMQDRISANEKKREFMKRRIPGATDKRIPKNLNDVFKFGDDFLSGKVDPGSLKDYMRSTHKPTRKMAQNLNATLFGQGGEAAAEYLDKIHPELGNQARKMAKSAAGGHEQGQFSDIGQAQTRAVDPKTGRMATQSVADIEKQRNKPMSQQPVDALTGKPIGTTQVQTAAATQAGAHATQARKAEERTKSLRDKFLKPGASDNVAEHVKTGDFGAARAAHKMNTRMTPHRNKLGKLGIAGVMGAGLLYSGASVLSGMAQARKEQLQGINMMNSDSVVGRLLENYQTWKTRKRVYGPSGRKHSTWKFNPENKHHRKLALGLNDAQFAKLSGSKADLNKKGFVKTIKGVPLKYTFFSNDRKHNYGGKTIGMRQKIISLHRRLEKPLPRGFENYSFEQVGNYFKRRANTSAWQQHHTAKLPVTKRLKLHGQDLLKKVKNLVTKGKFSESAEGGNLVEVQDFTPPQMTVECSFLAEKVTTPMDCGCADCAVVVKKIKESQDALRETSVTSFGQNLRGESDGRSRRDSFEEKKHKEFNRRRKHHKKRARVNEDAEIDYVTRPYKEGKSGIIQKISKMFYHPPRHDDD